MPERIAVVLFNLGGPDSPETVQPFLFNLFNDPAIITLPQPFRWLLAKLISSRRAPMAQEFYANLGGRSPLLPNTEEQADALQAGLAARSQADWRCFIAMRYWHPLTDQTVAAVRDWQPDRVVLLPLYPQYSTTTSASSLKLWRQTASRAGLGAPMTTVCCYPALDGFVTATAELVRKGIREASGAGKPRVLFSAHGLPQKVIDAGDPYQFQVERTAEAVVAKLGGEDFEPVVCYQSRVGPLKWIQPYTEDEVQRAGADKVPLVVVPIAFVSEHSETLVELDIEYRELAEQAGVPLYCRVPTVSSDAVFIEGLATLILDAVKRGDGVFPDGGARICPAGSGGCAQLRFA